MKTNLNITDKSSHNTSETSELSARAFPPEKNFFKSEYEKFEKNRQHIVNDIKEQIEQILLPLNSNAVVSGRIKNFESFFFKYIKLLKSDDNNPKITDLLGIRIICPFIEDISAAEQLINENFQVEEKEKKGHASFKEFGYESIHILIKIPDDIIKKHGDAGIDIVEIQIRTILQDAWAEVEHELVYKAEFSPFDEPMKRKLAAVNASLSLADIIFQEIRSYQRKFTKEMDKRRESFFQKIEESTDELLFSEEHNKGSGVPGVINIKNIFEYNENASIDDLLIGALSAHNQNRFNDAINFYSKILELKPNKSIRSIIYKHRGMANFACSCYNEAIDDFNNAFAFDNKSYKVVYYRGVVHSVLKEYSSAIDDYTLSLSINPYQSFCLFRRAQAYYHIGDYPQALADCENSLALEPQNKSAIKFRDLLHDKLKM
jgi:putative GTP pyrophosphokinase